MKIAPGTALDVSLHWDTGEIQPVGRLAYRDRVAYLEFADGFSKSGLRLSPVHYDTNAGLQRRSAKSASDLTQSIPPPTVP